MKLKHLFSWCIGSVEQERNLLNIIRQIILRGNKAVITVTEEE